MTQSQPQRRQRPGDTSLWLNKYKNDPKQPDYRGNIKVSWELVQELYAAFQSGNYQIDDYTQQPYVQLDMTLWGHNENVGTTKPVLTGGASTLAETMAQAARRAENRVAQEGFGGSPEQIAAQQRAAAEAQALAQQQAQAQAQQQALQAQAAAQAQQAREQTAALLAHQQQQQQAAWTAQQAALLEEAARQAQQQANAAQTAQAVAAPIPTPVAPAALPAPPASPPTPIAGTIHGGGTLPSPVLPANF